MLKDFVKLETFLTVARERSFSKASAKLGISQPAVTQQIKFVEKYLGAKTIERKKNGIKLTAEGEELYKAATRLEKSIYEAEKDILKIINKEITFRIGASFTIGHYVIPGQCLNTIGDAIHNDITLAVHNSTNIVELLKDRKLDVGLVESYVQDNSMIYREWLEDELVVFSNTPIPKILKTEDLYEFDWVCREEGSHTKKIISEKFAELNINCKDFNVVSEVNSSTALLNTIARSKQNLERPMVSIISKYTIAQEVANKQLFQSKIKGLSLDRNLYIVYHKNNKNNPYTKSAVDFILSGRC
jgi:DNA-binding transcriptional LysR family regulator